MKIFTFLAAVVISVFLTACNKSAVPVPDKLTPVIGTLKSAGIATPVSGKWQWLKSAYANIGLQTPAITGYTERLEFGNDSVMTIYRNDVFYYQLQYLYVKNYTYKGSSFDVLKVNGSTYRTVIKNDTLNMATFDVADASSLTYLRIK